MRYVNGKLKPFFFSVSTKVRVDAQEPIVRLMGVLLVAIKLIVLKKRGQI